MTPRELNRKLDALFVEGPDDGAFVNAFVRKCLGVDLAQGSNRIVRVNDAGGGANWALDEFRKIVPVARKGARIGVIVDRDMATNDQQPRVKQILRDLSENSKVGARFGAWLWPDNTNYGALEDFVENIIPDSPILSYAIETSRVAKATHGAEYEDRHRQKAALKVRSVWCDASAAGGYGHLVRNLGLRESDASRAFSQWFRDLFLEG